jgi:HSP20 family protein
MNTTLSNPNENTTTTTVNYRRPAYTVDALEGSYEVRVQVPGCNKEGINLAHEKDTLTIVASRKDVRNPDWRLLHREVRDSDYELKLNLNVDIDIDKISANTEDGVLIIRLPVAEQTKPKLIQVD